MADFLALAATAAGLLMAASPVLQIRRMLATRSSDDFSIQYMLVLVVGFLIWVSYGIAIGNPVLILTNSASLTFGVITVIIAARLR
jgi:MtN3 and saliva related transmembrane protein